jgi:exonuclease III
MTPIQFTAGIPRERRNCKGQAEPHTEAAKSNKGGSSANGIISQKQQKENCDKFVLYNVGELSARQVWEELRAFLNPEMLKGIKAVKKVNPKHRPSRMDLYVHNSVSAGLKRTVRSMTKDRTPKFVDATQDWVPEGVKRRARPLSQWRIDLWKGWRDRPELKSTTTETIPQKHNHIVSLNINGLASKKLELIDLLEREQISICALQETLVSAKAYQVNIPGYVTYTQHWCEGFRGQAILVKNHLSSYEVGRQDKHYLHVKVNGLPGVEQPVHIIALYLPSGGNFRRKRREYIRKVLVLNREILDNQPGAPIIILGDWNMTPDNVSKELEPDITGLRLYKTKGSPLSRFPKNTCPKAIDHMVVSDGAVSVLKRPRVFRNYGISDHRPLIAAFRAVMKCDKPPVVRWRIDTDNIKRNARELVHSNRWAVLSVDDMDGEYDLNTATEKFVGTLDSVSKELGIKTEKVMGKPRFPRQLKTLLKRRNLTAKKVAEKKLRKEMPSEQLKERLRKQQAAYVKAKTAWTLRRNNKEIGNTCRDIRGCDYKKVWARIRRKITHNGTSDALTPIRNKKGVLCVTNSDILAAIAEHYNALANADAGPSQDAEHWASIDLGVPNPEIKLLNGKLTWPDILLSIRRMNRNTTPHEDGIHINMLKELLHEECMAQVLKTRKGEERPELVTIALPSTELPETPLTPLGKNLFPILLKIWQIRTIPDIWNEVFICNIYKTGDPELMVNYRGISLISVGFKVLLGVMADRLYAACNEIGYLVPEQAGFRRHEEAIAQYIAVAEMARRRGIKNLPTYAVFIDFKKAFDKVHHEALYRILDHMGVRGTFLELIKAMYRNAEMTVKAGGQKSESFGMLRGNRQGCPLSPLLFIIFVNHLLKEASAGGISVPGITVPVQGGSCSCPGGMYADDLVGLESSAEAAKAFCIQIYNWGRKWGMELGILKCGVLLWSDDDKERELYEATSFTTPDGEIPKVDMYKYLGIELETSLPRERIPGGNEANYCKKQAAKGEKVLNTLRPLLRDPTWPLPVKVGLIRTLLMSIMMYGAEWLGYKQANAPPIQRVITKALKLAMGNSSRSRVHETLTLSYELGLPLVEEEQAALRARLSAKLQHTGKFRTWIKALYEQPLSARKKTWMTTNTRWEKETLRGQTKYDGIPCRPWVAKGHEYEAHTRSNVYTNLALNDLRNARSIVDSQGFHTGEPPTGVQRMEWGLVADRSDPIEEQAWMEAASKRGKDKNAEEQQLIDSIRNCTLERMMTANKNPAFQFYTKYGIGATRGYLRASLSYPLLSESIAWLVRARTRSFPRVNDRWQAIIRSGNTPHMSKDKCPLCGHKIEHGWEWEHLVMTCDDTQIEEARLIHLAPSIESLQDQLRHRLDVYDDMTEVFGNRTANDVHINRAIAIYLIGGVINNNFDTPYHISFGQTDDLGEDQETYGFVKIAQFFGDPRVAKRYMASLFPEGGDPLYANQDDFVSLYTPSPGGRSVGSSDWSRTSTPYSPRGSAPRGMHHSSKLSLTRDGTPVTPSPTGRPVHEAKV